MTKTIAKLATIVIILVNTEVGHIKYVIYNIVYLKEFPWFFAMDQTMIIILTYMREQKCSKDNSLPSRKSKTFSVPIKQESKKIEKMEKKLLKLYLINYNFLITQDYWPAYY